MKSYRKWFLLPAGLLIAALAAHGELDKWVENIDSGNKLEGVFFKAFPMGTGTVVGRRHPKETRVELSKLIEQSPTQADLLSLRALEAEKQLDFTSAEADWKKYVELAKDKSVAGVSLADYYHRRLMTREEIAALRAVATEPSTGDADPHQQPAWLAFERIIQLIDAQLLEVSVATEQYEAWVARYPKESDAYRRACLALIQKKQFPAAEQILARYEREFPSLVDFPTQARAGIELAKGSPANALAAYEKSFRPVWSEDLATGYFSLLKEEGQSRKFLDQTRTQISATPAALEPPARLYYYYRQQNDSGNAAHVLFEFRKHKEERKSAWTAAEHETLAALFEKINQYDDAARHYHALYVHPSATPAQAEAALAGLVDLLLTAAEQPIQIGSGEFSYYRDIATMDRSPGYLNGVLSLLLNSSDPHSEYERQNGQAPTYFHRVKAAQLDGLFEQKYPKSERRAGLRAKLIQAYSTYGETQAVIDNGKQFLTAFPNAEQRTEVALLMADGYARLEKPDDEFALYKQLLIELAAKAGGKPIGALAVEVPSAPQQDPPQDSDDQSKKPEDRAARLVNQAAGRAAKPDSGVKSQDYVRVLDRYLARLVSLEKMPDALRVYRNELTRNSSDPGLYERFAAFLDQNKLGGQIERVYKDAMQKFPDETRWSHKLARWYLRQSQKTQYVDLTRQVTQIFSGTALEEYFNETAGQGELGMQLYLRVNLFAHERFPHNLTFVRNLLTAYQAKMTANPVAHEKLLRENWAYAPDLRSRFFELLSRTKRLDVELAALRTMKPEAEANPVATRMLAEAEVWKTNYEAAAQPFRLLAASLPAEAAIDERAASLHRSLDRTAVAIQIESQMEKADPRNRDVLTRMGEIDADHERYERAAGPWRRMATLEPGKPDGYLESATVFWDYFQFADAMKMIEQGRQKLRNPALFAYEAGAIRENQRDYPAALNEYAKGALAEGQGKSRDRFLKLAKRPKFAGQTAAIAERIGASQNPANISFRIAYFENLGDAKAFEQYLNATLSAATSPDVIALVETSARGGEMPQLMRRVIERRIALTSDPTDRLKARMDLARFFESQGDATQAAATIEALYKENPTTLGIIRSTVNYYWRNRQTARTVDLLVASADRAEQPYQDRFRFEAAQKAIEGGLYDRGQQLISSLLEKEPYRADYLAVSGDLYAKRGDDNGLRTYYVNTIESLRKSPLSADEKIARVASLRRSFIPVLVRLKDYSGALDQYIEVINRYPEDDGLVSEAALFALQNGQRQRLTDYYTKTAATASRDHRWPIVMSRIETIAENYPGALEWLGKARAIRPERTDFLAAKGPLEERLLKFEDAAKTYSVLWELAYHDPQWMVKAAEQYERLGRHADAISAIRKAYIDGRPETPQNYLSAATQANQWNELDATQEFAAKGLAIGTNSAPSGLLALQGVIPVRRHAALPMAWKDMDATVATKWGEAVARYATPEEKQAIASKLVASTGKPIATGAGFVELLNQWEPPVVNGAVNQAWIQLEKSRGKLDEIAPRLEAAAKNGTLSAQQRATLVGLAREYYAESGNTAEEIRLLEQWRTMGIRDAAFVTRYSELAARDRKQALGIITNDPNLDLRNAVANQVLMSGNASDALAAVQARGTAFKPVWTKAYTAMTGLHYDLRTPQIRLAFEGVLGPQTIGEQLGHEPNAAEQVDGVNWYYYATRFGEYLTTGSDPAGENYMLARLEASPGATTGYSELAAFYEERKDYAKSLKELDYVLQLAPASADPHGAKAAILARQGQLPAAIEEWRLAFRALQGELGRRQSNEWWDGFRRALTDVGQYKSLDPLRDDVSKLARTSFKINGAFNSDVILQAIVEAPGDPQAGVEWLTELIRSAPEPNQVLALTLQSAWLPDAQRDVVYSKEVEFAQAKADSTVGPGRSGLREVVVNYQVERIRDLVAHGNMAKAEALMKALPAAVVDSRPGELGTISIRLAAKRGALDELFGRYQRDPEHAPSAEILQQTATELRQAKEDASAYRVLEYLYSRELAARNFTGPNFLGYAEVKLSKGDLAGALELLRRMNLMVGQPFELLNDSGMLLWRTGHRKEASEYFEQLVKVRPWEPEARLNLALVRETSVVNELAAVAQNPVADYGTRMEAAQAIRKAGGMDGLKSGAPELDLIAGKGAITEAQVSQPFYVTSRMMAAEALKDAASRFRILGAAVSISPARPRYELFRAAVELKRWNYANSLLDGYNLDSGLDGPKRIELLRGIAEVKRQLGDTVTARKYLDELLPLLDGDPYKAVAQAIEAQRAQDEARVTNEMRRPVISEALLPDRIVMPRVAAVVGGNQ